MPWEITIVAADGRSMGDRATVERALSAARPDLRIQREPAGPEMVAAMEAQGGEMPAFLREQLLAIPARAIAELDGDGFSLRLYGFDGDDVRAFHGEVRGDGDPSPTLSELCRANGWVVIDDATEAQVELADGPPAEWSAFQAFRDAVIDRDEV